MRFFPSFGLVVCACSVVSISVLADEDAYVLEQGTVSFRTHLEMRVEALRARTLVSPLPGPRLEWLIPDGSYVSSGQVVTVFAAEDFVRELQDRQLEKRIIEAEDLEDESSQRKADLERRDALAELMDMRAVKEAELARVRALPDPAVVRIAEGQLRVARLEYEAAARDAEKAETRYAEGMISGASRDESLFQRKEKQVALTRAEQVLAFRRRPATEYECRRLELEIANLDLDIRMKELELSQNEEILVINREGRRARRDIEARRIQMAEAYVENLELRSPQDGYISYRADLRSRYMASGRRMRRNYAFLEMPDYESLILRGSIRENDRQFLEEGDPARVRFHVRDSEEPDGVGVVTGRISRIGVLSRDQGEKEEERFGSGDEETGVKVYDVTVTLASQPKWLRIGMHADVELVSPRPVEGLIVPSGYVTVHDGTPFLCLDGEMVAVDGGMAGEFFVVRGHALAGRRVSLFGQAGISRRPGNQERNGRNGLRVQGELIPVDLEPTRVGRIYGWQKVAWAIAENALVEAGQIVARLDDETVNEELTQVESRLQEAVSKTQSTRQTGELTQKLDAWKVELARNTADMRRLGWEAARDERDEIRIISAEAQVQRAELALERLRGDYARSEAKGHRLLSPMAKAELEREIRRAELGLESVRIELTLARRGPEESTWRREELRALEAQRDAQIREREEAFNAFSRDRTLARAEADEAGVRKRLAWLLESKANLAVPAPRAGVVRYSKVWDAGRIRRVREGVTVGSFTRLMEIADITDMEVRVGVPERYFEQVRKGLGVEIHVSSMEGLRLKGAVEEVEFLFEDRRRKDAAGGIYSIQEHLGETEFFIRVSVEKPDGVELKPGAMVEVVFPFDQQEAR